MFIVLFLIGGGGEGDFFDLLRVVSTTRYDRCDRWKNVQQSLWSYRNHPSVIVVTEMQ